MLQVALGEAAMVAIDHKQYQGKPGGDSELAVQLWWRAAGLQALQGYVLAVLGTGLLPSGEQAVQAIAGMLTPVLDAASNQVSYC
jgi:hypothetical protein